MKSNAYVCAVRLLARREHGAYELAHKLAAKGYSEQDVQAALAECQRLDLQNDFRFVEMICHLRIRQGYGPLRIRQELQQLQVDPEYIETVLQLEHDNWLEYATDVWKKKYKEQPATSYPMLQKQKQFLHYRGFSSDIINRVVKE